MASTFTLPGPATKRTGTPSPIRLTEPQLSRLILAGTGVTGFLVLLLWLVIGALIRPPLRASNVQIIDLGHPQGVSEAGPQPQKRVHDQIDRLLGRAGGGSAIVVIRGWGVSRPGAGSPNCYLLAPGGGVGSPPIEIPVNAIIKQLRDREQRGSTLLVLDCWVPAGDRSLGVFGNGFVGELKKLLEEEKRIAVLAACDAGQSNWALEGRAGTVFGHFLAEVLEERRVRRGSFGLKQLVDDAVAPRIARWVGEHRGGPVPTPVLLGNTELTFRLDGPKPRLLEAPEQTDADVTRTENLLRAEWQVRNQLAAATPPPRRHVPLAWRRYQERLLIAERLVRAGEWLAARSVLDEIKRYCETRIRTQITGPVLERPWSLALLPQTADQKRAAYTGAIERLIEARSIGPLPSEGNELGEPDNGAAARTKGAAGAPAEDREAPAKDKAAPPRPGPDPLAALTVAGDPLKATYVEGQVPVWYAEFERRGGEAVALRAKRLGLVQKAVAVRSLAEEAATLDPRLTGRVRPLIEAGDILRRKAQDYLFAGDEKSLEECDRLLGEATETCYEKALTDARAFAHTLAFLDRVQDELPYYGEWAVRSGSGSNLSSVLAAAADLADQLSSIREPSPALSGTQERLEHHYGRLEDEFRSQLARAETLGWQDIDALLNVPWIDPEVRGKLVRRARTLTPTGSETPAPGNSKSGPAFLELALGLARLESGLLRLGGRDVHRLDERIEEAGSVLRRDALLASAGFSTLSEQVSALRGQALEAARSDAGGARSARLLTSHELEKLDHDGHDPVRQRDERDLQELTLWCGRRLMEDFDIDAARRVLNSPGLKTLPEWAEAVRLLEERQRATLQIKLGGLKTLGTVPEATVTSQGSFPREPGQATVFLENGPEARVLNSADNLNRIPVPMQEPIHLKLTNDGGVRIRTIPTAFFRGRFYKGEGVDLPVTQLVKVEVRQAVTEVTIKQKGLKDIRIKHMDQFEEHPTRGYLRRNNRLDYRLKITNESDRRLSLFVTREFADVPESNELVIDAGKQNDSIVGAVFPEAFVKVPQQTLTVTVREGGEDGRSLCKPVAVIFEMVDPRDSMHVVPALWNRILWLTVNHLGRDPVPVPMTYHMIVEPAGSVTQLNNPTGYVGRGNFVPLKYFIADNVEKITWRLVVEGLQKEPETMKLIEIPKVPPPANQKNGEEVPPGGLPGGNAPQR
jgi:hypothetical protein